MELIYEKLSELGIKETDLPVEIQKQIDHLDSRVEFLNKTIDKLESEGLTEDEITEQTQEIDESIDAQEENIIASIEAWHGRKSGSPVVQNNKPTEKVKEEDSGFGWVLAGVVVFAVTLGAVNVWKNR
jgi:hypothetical protein